MDMGGGFVASVTGNLLEAAWRPPPFLGFIGAQFGLSLGVRNER
jgi:hypothetical protein